MASSQVARLNGFPKVRRANPARRSSHFLAQGLSNSETPPKKVGFSKPKPGSQIKTLRRAQMPEGFCADAFFGASPVVASALGFRLGATLANSLTLNTALRFPKAPPELSTWRRIGTFYLALTEISSILWWPGEYHLCPICAI